MTFEEWWTQRETVAGCALDGADNASAAWGYQQDRIETKNSIIMSLEDALKESQQKHLDSIRALRRANEQITSIAKDNGKLRTDLESYQEPKKERSFKYIAIVNEVCEDEADAFYMGTLDDIMEWCEDWNHCINDVKFYRLGDEVRIGFVDMGKETRFGGGK